MQVSEHVPEPPLSRVGDDPAVGGASLTDDHLLGVDTVPALVLIAHQGGIVEVLR